MRHADFNQENGDSAINARRRKCGCVNCRNALAAEAASNATTVNAVGVATITAASVGMDIETVDQMMDAKARRAATFNGSATIGAAAVGESANEPDALTVAGTRCQEMAGEAYRNLHQMVSIGRSIACIQLAILSHGDKGDYTNRKIGVYLRNNNLTPEDGAKALALYLYGVTGPDPLDQAVKSADARAKSAINSDGGNA